MIRKDRGMPACDRKGLILEIDGCMVDSRIDLANSVNAMLRQYKKPELPNDLIASYIGNGAPVLVRRSLGDPDDETFVQEALLYFMAYYREHKLDTTYVYDGIKEALDLLGHVQNDGVASKMKMAVLSNKPVGPSKAIVEALGLGQYFFQVYGGIWFFRSRRFRAITAISAIPGAPFPLALYSGIRLHNDGDAYRRTGA